ncbi:MAG: hypothetical protein KTR26_21685 [Flammeovirgaceae bacterium]|nr:hypothetical protein [Flammeovirgaceae bacterium]
MKSIYFYTLIGLLFTGFFSSCDDDNMDPEMPGTVSLMLENKFGDANVDLSSTFTSSKGDEITFSRFEYIISNVELVKEDGSIYSIPDSYYFMGQRSTDDSKREMIELKDIPAGNYKGINFSVGVDSETNANTDNFEKGDLEGGVGMDWGWASGYKFISWNGSYFNDVENKDVNFSFHIGTDANYKTITKDFGKTISINDGMTSQIHLEVMAGKVFEAVGLNETGLNYPPPADVKTFTGVMFSPEDKATAIANAYAEMFMLHHVHNMEMN